MDKEEEKRLKVEQRAAEEKAKQFKKDGIRTLGDFHRIQSSLESLETGIFALDMAIGHLGSNGLMGIRQRDIAEFAGFSGVGKTSVGDQITLTTTKKYGPESVFYLFSEPPEVERMIRKGINPDDVVMRCSYEPDIEEKKNLAEQHLGSALDRGDNPKTKVVIIDTVAALCTSSVLFHKNSYRDVEQAPVASLAKVFTNFLIQWNQRNASNSVLILMNQYKKSIGTSYIPGDDAQVWTPGGSAINFFSWVRCMVNGSLKSADKESRHSVEGTKQADSLSGSFKLFKNKYGHLDNDRTVKWELDLETGFYNNEEKLIDWASYFGVIIDDPDKKGAKKAVSELVPPIAKAGAWVSIGDERFQGMDNAVEYLRANPDIYDMLKIQMYQRAKTFFKDEGPKNLDTLLDGE